MHSYKIVDQSNSLKMARIWPMSQDNILGELGYYEIKNR